MTLVGPHINSFQPGVKQAAFGAGIIKTLDHSHPEWLADQHASGTFIIGREYVPENQYSLGVGNIRKLAQRVITQHRSESYDAWEFPINEAYQSNPGDIVKLAKATRLFTDILHDNGIKVIVGSFSTENPDLLFWSAFYPALETADYLGLHQYSHPTLMDNTENSTLRHEKVYELLPEELRKPLIITEAGIDHFIEGDALNSGNHRGWKSYATASEYSAQLKWLHNKYSEFPYMFGWVIYCLGQYGDWNDFDLLSYDEVYIWKETEVLTGDCLLIAQWPSHKWASWDYDAARVVVESRFMTITLSVDDAMKYKRVYIIGGEGGITPGDEAKLRTRGRQVTRIYGPLLGLPDTIENTKKALIQLAMGKIV